MTASFLIRDKNPSKPLVEVLKMISDPYLFWVLHSYIGISEQFFKVRNNLKCSKWLFGGGRGWLGWSIERVSWVLCSQGKGGREEVMSARGQSCLWSPLVCWCPHLLTAWKPAKSVIYVSLWVQEWAESYRECYYVLCGGLLSLPLLMNVWWVSRLFSWVVNAGSVRC